MASPPLQVEDQTDEDFFNQLVDDEIDSTRSGPGIVEGDDADEAKVFRNPSISEVGTAGVSAGNVESGVNVEQGNGDGAVSTLSDTGEDALVTSSKFVTPGTVIESGDEAVGEESLPSTSIGENSGSSGRGVKVVQWSSFNSDSHLQGGIMSYSDFFNELGDRTRDPFDNAVNQESSGAEFNNMSSVSGNPVEDLSSLNSTQHQESQNYGVAREQAVDGQDLNSSQHWEELYPGWRYDPRTGEWHQLEGYDANASMNAQIAGDGIVSNQRSDAHYFQQTTQSLSIMGSVAEECTGGSVPNWNQISQGNVEYPAHMVFDPQYPGWYYDTIALEWRLLESYNPSVNHSMTVNNNQQNQTGSVLSGNFFTNKSHTIHEQVENYGLKGLSGQSQVADWDGSASDYCQQQKNIWQPETVSESSKSLGIGASYEQTSHGFDGTNEVSGFQSFTPGENLSRHHNQTNMDLSQQMQFSPAYFDGQKSVNLPQQPHQSDTQFSYAPKERWSSAGRPPHPLVTFGFGGKLLVMKDNGSFLTNSSYGHQDSAGGVVNVLNLMDVVVGKNDSLCTGTGGRDYFHILSHQSFPGPLVGGNVGSRELNKWVDEKIAKCESSNMDYRKGEESDSPESAVAKLFSYAKRNGVQHSEYGTLTRCLQNLPSEAQIQATALEVQKLLVSGRKKEALGCAIEGQLWGPALVLAAQLGDQFYGDTVKQMALQQLVAGSPLRTLCLLIAGQPADVFSNTANISQQSGQIWAGANSMLDEWEENLAIITANRTKDDELVIIHLGDCLWKERGEITIVQIAAAHICYLVAEANFESYSDSARLCLIGADHWKFPRTYASPEAIQRTEFYEYSKVLGNSQFILLPFQPYKIIYAHMLAEVGKVSDSLKYCKAILKSLKTGRAPEVETWKLLVSSLDERIRTHQQGGYSTNLAPTKLVGKLLTLFDSTAHRVVGGLPPPVPSASHGNVRRSEQVNQPGGPRVSNSQSTMAMSSLMPSASMEPISDWMGEGNRLTKPNRSISEPDFGRTPRKVDSSKEASPDIKASSSGHLLVLAVLAHKYSKRLWGEKNKFYYDEKLKRWVEEGTELPSEEAALPPPPPTSVFQNGMPDSSMKDAAKVENSESNGGPEIKSPNSSERGSGIPPIPPSSNQFSARGRMGVRSSNKLVPVTFNSIPKPGIVSNPKFFIPTPIASGEETIQTTRESIQEATGTNENLSRSVKNDGFAPPPTSTSSSMAMQRHPSMNDILYNSMGTTAKSNPSVIPHSRRTASWSGTFSDSISQSIRTDVKPLGEVLGMNPSQYLPSNSSPMRFSVSGNSIGDDLHEVEL
ncbi:Protein transport protein SEC16B-like [Vitis vinifera]|uniref:Protein transport protein sec16 n=1 Tax=Vitis vinifera TaxID=29760 RepID=A0A438IKE2_VITVI|nr:Protein transport protein SEC16B-like [Vitis vinifera]